MLYTDTTFWIKLICIFFQSIHSWKRLFSPKEENKLVPKYVDISVVSPILSIVFFSRVLEENLKVIYEWILTYFSYSLINYRICANKWPLLIRTPEWRYIQILYILFKYSRLEHTKFEYKATLKPSKIYRTPSFYLRGYGNWLMNKKIRQYSFTYNL